MQSASEDHAAFAELYDRTSAQVYGIALRLLRAPDLAADVTQEVFIDVWFQASRFDPRRGSVLGWMVTMAHRRAVDRVRSISRARSREQTWALGEVRRADAEEAWGRLAETLDADYVQTALRHLSVVQREALYLTYLCGLSAAEAARLMDAPLGTVKTRMRNGLICLRQQLSQHPSPESQVG